MVWMAQRRLESDGVVLVAFAPPPPPVVALVVSSREPDVGTVGCCASPGVEAAVGNAAGVPFLSWDLDGQRLPEFDFSDGR